MTDSRKRWIALVVLCLGDLMIVLDATIVNVALPSIRADLGFSQTSLAWVVNAYMLTFGGFLLLGGRLAQRRRHACGRRNSAVAGKVGTTRVTYVTDESRAQNLSLWLMNRQMEELVTTAK